MLEILWLDSSDFIFNMGCMMWVFNGSVGMYNLYIFKYVFLGNFCVNLV